MLVLGCHTDFSTGGCFNIGLLALYPKPPPFTSLTRYDTSVDPPKVAFLLGCTSDFRSRLGWLDASHSNLCLCSLVFMNHVPRCTLSAVNCTEACSLLPWPSCEVNEFLATSHFTITSAIPAKKVQKPRPTLLVPLHATFNTSNATRQH